MARDTMEITRYQSFNEEGSSSRVCMNKNSHVISKIKPKIRIIHLFAPEVIKTDVKNFRALVQSLSGKSAAGKKRAKPRILTPQEPVCGGNQQPVKKISGFSLNHEVKEEWGSRDQSTSNTNTYFDLEGLIQDVEQDYYFSSCPMRSYSSSQVEGFIYDNFNTKGHNSS